jgi:SSS family solute:Na+ symporter
VVIKPGLIALVLHNNHLDFQLPLKTDGRVDFDMTLPSLLAHYYPTGILGVGLTALLASFMSGMAGNVTAFHAVWTYDIYQAHLKKDASDQHYLLVGKVTTVVGILISIGTAYLARQFNNIMDLLQLIFGFVNAPLFATFMLGMFWKRATADGAFFGLLLGTLAATATHGLTVAEGKGGWLVGTPIHTFQSGMGQAFLIAIMAWTTCFVATIAVSLVTRAKSRSELNGLVYGLTDSTHNSDAAWYHRPIPLSICVIVATAFLNYLFW